MDTVRINFNNVYNELIKTTKKTKIARGIGFTSTVQLHKTLKGSSTLSTRAIINLIKNFNINPTYIFLGTGDMFLNKQPIVKTYFDYSNINVTIY